MDPILRTRFSALYGATLKPLRDYLARVLGNRSDAQDLAHEAYARVYAAMREQEIVRPEAFLYTTARRLALSQLRRREISPVSELDGDKIVALTPADVPGVQELVIARQEWVQLEAAIAGLPPGCRQVLLMCRMERKSHPEVAAALGISVSTVEKQHARALRLLRVAFSEHAQNPATMSQDAGDAAGA
jgi:RNA polymerase sigma factor (sigma-70 family)